MNKTPYELAAESAKATLDTEKEVSGITQRAVNKLVDFQFGMVAKALEAGTKQANPYADVKTVEDIVKTNTDIAETAARENLDNARKLVDIVTETRDAYSALYEKGVANAITPLVPKAAKKAA